MIVFRDNVPHRTVPLYTTFPVLIGRNDFDLFHTHLDDSLRLDKNVNKNVFEIDVVGYIHYL